MAVQCGWRFQVQEGIPVRLGCLTQCNEYTQLIGSIKDVVMLKPISIFHYCERPCRKIPGLLILTVWRQRPCSRFNCSRFQNDRFIRHSFTCESPLSLSLPWSHHKVAYKPKAFYSVLKIAITSRRIRIIQLRGAFCEPLAIQMIRE